MSVRVITGDCREVLAGLDAESVDCVVTSPPYFGLRDYGVDGQIGREPTPAAFVAEMVAVFRLVRRVLKPEGTAWLNLGDSYAHSPARGRAKVGQAGKQGYLSGQPSQCRIDLVAANLKPKDLIGIPWRVAFALQDDGWWLRSDVVWRKLRGLPESVKDRPTRSHEYVFMLTRSERYFYDYEAVLEPLAQSSISRLAQKVARQTGSSRAHAGAAKPMTAVAARGPNGNLKGAALRDVWDITPAGFSGAHFAVMPVAVAETCIKASCPQGGLVLDPFGGAGTTGLVADRLGRSALLIEINPEYTEMARRRIAEDRGELMDSLDPVELSA